MTQLSRDLELRLALDAVIQSSALFLDERRFGNFLDLTAQDFRYRIQAYSHDIRRPMTWLSHDRAGLIALFELLPKHHVNGADWLRQVSLQTVTRHSDTEASTTSSLAIFETVVDVGDAHVEGGSSRLFAVGRYHDRFRLEDTGWQLTERVVFFHTRQLGTGSHLIP